MSKLTLAAVAGFAILVSGCASNKTPTFGEALMNRSGEAGKISKDWNTGDKLVTKGEKALKLADEKQKKAEKLQKEVDTLKKDAAKLQENGTKWRAEGTAKKADAEARYGAMRAEPVAVPAPAPAAE